MDEKELIRKEALRHRDALTPHVRTLRSSIIREKFLTLPEFARAVVIMFFASFRSEVDTLLLIEESLRIGKRVVVPRVERGAKILELYEVRDISELSAGYMGIPEPPVRGDRKSSLDGVNLIVMPGAAFDINGNRLGYGGGFYDRLLSDVNRSTPLIALAFHEQIVDRVPSELHDIRVHKIITDAAIINCPSH